MLVVLAVVAVVIALLVLWKLGMFCFSSKEESPQEAEMKEEGMTSIPPPEPRQPKTVESMIQDPVIQDPAIQAPSLGTNPSE